MTQRLLLPGKDRNVAGAEFVPAALFDALDFLEIDRPVQIKWSAGLRRRGTHRFRDGVHVITVSTYLDAATLNVIAWHELVHALQLERYDDPDDFERAYRISRQTAGYDRSKFEVEARESAEYLATEIPVTR